MENELEYISGTRIMYRGNLYYFLRNYKDDAKIFEALDKLHECLQKTDDALLNVQGQLATGIIVKMVGNGDEEVQD